jgi:hypothetical protein
MPPRQPAPLGANRQPTASGRLPELFAANKILVGVLVGVGLLLGVSFPFALSHDESLDRQRSGYTDAVAVARLQDRLLEQGQQPQEFEVGPGDSVDIGEETFTPSPGNTVVAIAVEDGFCVQVTNDVRDWTYDSLDGEFPYDDHPGGACGG